MRARRLVAAAVALVTGAAGLAAATAPAHAGDTPGTYSNWAFEGVDGLSDVAYTITVEEHPGQQSQIYWSNQVDWTNGHGGYAGMQTNADPEKNMFLFSVWDVTEARPGDEGSWCEKFGGEGEGMSCRIYHRWTAGQTYRFHYRAEGDGWWGMTVTNLDTGTSFKLGSIKVGGDLMIPTSVSWVEYYRWSDPRSSCGTEPYSRARFGLPTGNDGSLTAKITGTKVNPCPGLPQDGATVEQGDGFARHTLGIGQSVMGAIGQGDGQGDDCLDVQGGSDADGTPVTTHGCHDGGNQAWVVSYDGAIRSKLFTCLTAGADGAESRACTGAASQTWTVEDGALVNQGRCLDASATRPTLADCDGSDAQQWTTPERP